MVSFIKHACFILKFKDFCNSCVHFQWKITNAWALLHKTFCQTFFCHRKTLAKTQFLARVSKFPKISLKSMAKKLWQTF